MPYVRKGYGKFRREEIDHMRELYFRRNENWTIPAIARFFRCSVSTVNKAIEGKLRAKDEDIMVEESST